MDFDLHKVARDNYKESILASWVFAIVLAVLAAASACLGVVSFLLVFLVVMLIIYPIFFSFMVSHTVAREKEPITFSTQFSRSIAFFRNGNSRSFKLISSFLFSLLFYFASSFVFSIIALIVFRIVKPDIFNEMMSSFTQALLSGSETTLSDLLTQYESYLIILEVASASPAMIFATGFFFYRTSINSICVYARRILHKFDPSMNVMIHNQVFKNVGRQIRKDYFSLNWPFIPLYVIFSLGVGFVVAYYINLDPAWVSSLGVASGLLSLMFFFPFFFGNMEAIYQKYEMEYKRATIEVTKKLYESIRQRIDLNEEEKKTLEDALNRLNGNGEDDVDEDEEE